MVNTPPLDIRRPRFIPPGSPEEKRLLKERAAQAQRKVSDLALVQDLAGLERDFLVIHTAHTLAVGGTTRAAASEIATAIDNAEGVTIDPSVVGQVCSQFGVPTKVSHGRSRLALDATQLASLCQQIVARIDVLEPELEAGLAEFDAIASRVDEMLERVRIVSDQVERAKRYREYLTKTQGMDQRVAQLEQQVETRKERARSVKPLEAAIAQLDERIKAVPNLTKRKQQLEARLEQAIQQSKALDGKESEVAAKERRNAQRAAPLGRKANEIERFAKATDLAELDQALADGRKELDQLQKQLGEKRGLLSRMLGGGGSA